LIEIELEIDAISAMNGCFEVLIVQIANVRVQLRQWAVIASRTHISDSRWIADGLITLRRFSNRSRLATWNSFVETLRENMFFREVSADLAKSTNVRRVRHWAMSGL
jgi:hypothetical protein